MLTIEAARRRRTGSGKLALALAGGGPLGAAYELGALHALNESILGRELTELDVYVGVSSGSFLAAGLANGFDTTTLGSLFIHGGSTLAPFSPDILLRPDLAEYASRLALLPRALAGSARQLRRDPWTSSWPALLSPLMRVLPTAAFDNKPVERYLHSLLSTPGHTDDFRKLRPRLYVVATNLDTGASVAFGGPGHRDVPISRAVVASAALPGLYPPVRIGRSHYVDGALIRTMHASLALEAGCDLVICVNPLVPFDASRAPVHSPRPLAAEGIDTILGQTFRALIHSRMQVGMASYGARFPAADTILLEPDRHDEQLFFTNVLRYSARHRLADHAYQQTRRDLRAQAGPLAAMLQRRGLALNSRLLFDRRRSFSTSARERALRVRRTTQRLGRALGRLERLLGAREEAARVR